MLISKNTEINVSVLKSEIIDDIGAYLKSLTYILHELKIVSLNLYNQSIDEKMQEYIFLS